MKAPLWRISCTGGREPAASCRAICLVVGAYTRARTCPCGVGWSRSSVSRSVRRRTAPRRRYRPGRALPLRPRPGRQRPRRPGPAPRQARRIHGSWISGPGHGGPSRGTFRFRRPMEPSPGWRAEKVIMVDRQDTARRAGNGEYVRGDDGVPADGFRSVGRVLSSADRAAGACTTCRRRYEAAPVATRSTLVA